MKTFSLNDHNGKIIQNNKIMYNKSFIILNMKMLKYNLNVRAMFFSNM